MLPTDARPGDAPEVSVILVNWNTADLANAAIASLKLHESAMRLEIIVVDNASSGDDGDRILREHPDVRLIRSDRNLGFAGGNNLGAGAATGEFLLLLNTDTLFTEPVLSACLAVAREHAPAIVGCRLRYADGSPQLSADAFPSVRGYLREAFSNVEAAQRRNLHRWERAPENGAHADWVCGAFLLVSRKHYLELGGLSEDIFMYGEDTEFCWRAARAGVGTVYLPRVSIVHYGGGGVNHLSSRSLILSDAGRLRSFSKMRGRTAAALLRGVFLLRSFVRVVAYALSAAWRPDHRRRLAVHIAGIRALLGLRGNTP